MAIINTGYTGGLKNQEEQKSSVNILLDLFCPKYPPTSDVSEIFVVSCIENISKLCLAIPPELGKAHHVIFHNDLGWLTVSLIDAPKTVNTARAGQ